ncbi:MAG: methionyl-tRNA formyltransferase [Promethearchaeia archaeon]
MKGNIVWLSANIFGYELLKELNKNYPGIIKAIITLSENSTTVMYDGVPSKKWYHFNIPVYEIININDANDILNRLNLDYVIVAGWRQIINKEILKIPRYGFIGFHPTLLPKGRGPAPIINSILEGWEESGVTMYYLSEGLDDGDIIGQEKFKIQENDHAWDVYQKVIEGGKRLINNFLPMLLKRTCPRIPQDNSKATYNKKRSLEENKIDFENESIEYIYRKIRAFSKPYLGAYIQKGDKKLIIWRAELIKS